MTCTIKHQIWIKWICYISIRSYNFGKLNKYRLYATYLAKKTDSKGWDVHFLLLSNVSYFLFISSMYRVQRVMNHDHSCSRKFNSISFSFIYCGISWCPVRFFFISTKKIKKTFNWSSWMKSLCGNWNHESKCKAKQKLSIIIITNYRSCLVKTFRK